MGYISAGNRAVVQRIQSPSSIQSGLDVGHNILASHASDEAGLLKKSRRLFHRIAKDQVAAGVAEPSRESLNRVNAGGRPWQVEARRRRQ
jgi:hypothetical protein